MEIQSLSNIDRATVGETRVKRGAKIDSLVQVGHACVVGEANIICAQVGMAGSSILEKNVLLAGQGGVAGPLPVPAGAIIYAQSGRGGRTRRCALRFTRFRRGNLEESSSGISTVARTAENRA